MKSNREGHTAICSPPIISSQVAIVRKETTFCAATVLLPLLLPLLLLLS